MDDNERVRLPEDEPLDSDFEQLLEGGRLSFTVGDVTYYLRQPTDLERDEARLEYQMRRAEMLDPASERGRRLAALVARPLPADVLAEIEARIEAVSEKLDDPQLSVWQREWYKGRLTAFYREKKQNAADPILAEACSLARNRWLAARLLEDEGGGPVGPWSSLEATVQDQATMMAARMARLQFLIPFVSARRSETGSS